MRHRLRPTPQVAPTQQVAPSQSPSPYPYPSLFLTLSLSLALSLALACGGKPPVRAGALASRVELAAGDVRALGPAGSGIVGTGDMLPAGADLEVGPGGRCLVRLADGSGLFLRAGSKISLGLDGFDLAAGEVWMDVAAREDGLLAVHAGPVTVTAEKAGLDVKRDGDKVEVVVMRGLAVVDGPGGRGEVANGEQALLAGGAAPAIQPIAFWEDWTGGMADHAILASTAGRASGRLYAIDRSRPGAPPQELQVREQEVRVVIRDGIARTEVTQSFFNPGGSPVEGWYWFTIPEGAAVSRYAMVVDGKVVDGEVIERKQAAAKYEEAVRRAFDPALLEWVDGRTFRSRIFPVPPAGERKVILAYTEFLPLAEGVTRYRYPMGEGDPVRIQEFSLSVDLGDAGRDLAVSTVRDARVEDDGRRVTMRRSGFEPRGDFLLELAGKAPKDPVRAVRWASGKNEADYVMLRYAPAEDWGAGGVPPGVVVVVVDTSAGGDAADRKLRDQAAEAVLRALSGGDRFAVVAADVQPRLVYPRDKGLAPAGEKEIAEAMEALSGVVSGGATDLGDVFGFSLELVHGAAQPAVLYVGDGFATVGEMKADELVERLQRSLSGSRARLFTLAVGQAARTVLLDRLAGAGGGRGFRVDLPEQVVQEAIAIVGALKTPTVTDLKLDLGVGLDQVFLTGSGKVARGQEVLLFARTHHPLPEKVAIEGTLGGAVFKREYPLKADDSKANGYVAQLWAMQYLRSLLGSGAEENRGTIVSLGVGYGLMTPFTSFLVLESDQAYRQQQIPRRARTPLWGAGDAAGALADAEGEGGFGMPFLFGCAKGGKAPAPAGATQAAAESKPAEASGSATSSPAPAAPPSEPSTASMSKEERRYAEQDVDKVAAYEGEKAKDGFANLLSRSNGNLDAGAGLGGLGMRGTGTGGGGALSPNKPSVALKGSAMDRRMAQAGLASVLGAMDDETASVPRADLATGAGVVLAAQVAQDRPIAPVEPCSDLSRKSLSVRRQVWSGRMAWSDVRTAWGVYRAAANACEVDGWAAEKALMDLLLDRARSADEIRWLLGQLRGRERVSDYVRREFLKRSIASGSGFPTRIAWAAVDPVIESIPDPQGRLDVLRRILSLQPNDPEALRRTLGLLALLGRDDEALATAQRLRTLGFATPDLLVTLGDMEARRGDVDAARRAYSEIVENNPWEVAARRLLGDVFLRNGWYEDAYRQYATLETLAGADPIADIRLALAAFGAGRTDESIRLLRKVAEMQLEPSSDDPREWARLWSVAAHARLLAAAAGDADRARAIERSLRRSEELASPVTLWVLTWEDLDGDLRLSLKRGTEEAAVASVRADPTGLEAIRMPAGADAGAAFEPVVAWGDRKPLRKVPWKLQKIAWDGKEFKLSETTGTLDPLPPIAVAASR